MCIFAKSYWLSQDQSSPSGKRPKIALLNSWVSRIIGKADMINVISFQFAFLSLLVLYLGVVLTGKNSFTTVVGDSYGAWLGIIVDAMLLYFINWAIRREAMENLINQFGSESNAFALDAAKQLRKKGYLVDGSLSGIDMTHAQLDRANLNQAKLRGADLTFASLKEASLVEADFSNSNLTGADLRQAECRWANFENANLRWAKLEGATLDGVKFDGADLRFAQIGNINPATVSMRGVIRSQHLTETEIALVQNSSQLIRKTTEEFSMAFYQELFKANPRVKQLFLSNIEDQVLKFAQVFELLVASLNRVESLLPALKSLGKRHANYGVQEHHYEVVGRALIATLKRSLGQHFNSEVETAWLKTYGLVTLIMTDAAKGLL